MEEGNGDPETFFPFSGSFAKGIKGKPAETRGRKADGSKVCLEASSYDSLVTATSLR